MRFCGASDIGMAMCTDYRANYQGMGWDVDFGILMGIGILGVHGAADYWVPKFFKHKKI